MPPISLPNVGTHFLPSTSHRDIGSYVPFLHNIPQPSLIVVGTSGHASYGPIGTSLLHLTSSWVAPKWTNIGN